MFRIGSTLDRGLGFCALTAALLAAIAPSTSAIASSTRARATLLSVTFAVADIRDEVDGTDASHDAPVMLGDDFTGELSIAPVLLATDRLSCS